MQGEDDELIWVRKCQPEDDVMLALTDGCVQRYSARMFRPMGRAARGTRAVKLRPDVGIVGMTILPAQVRAGSFCHVHKFDPVARSCLRKLTMIICRNVVQVRDAGCQVDQIRHW